MLEIDIAIVPFGDRKRRKIINRLLIANASREDQDIADYKCMLRKKTKGPIMAVSYVRKFDRMQNTALDLAVLALRGMSKRLSLRNTMEEEIVGDTETVQVPAEPQLLPEGTTQATDILV